MEEEALNEGEFDERPLEEQLPEPRHPSMPREDDEERLDRIIHELLETNDLAPKTKIGLHLTEIQFLCAKAKEILIAQPTLLELAAPLTVSLDQPFERFFLFPSPSFSCVG